MRQFRSPVLTCQQQAMLGAVLPQESIKLACAILEAVPFIHDEVVPGDLA